MVYLSIYLVSLNVLLNFLKHILFINVFTSFVRCTSMFFIAFVAVVTYNFFKITSSICCKCVRTLLTLYIVCVPASLLHVLISSVSLSIDVVDFFCVDQHYLGIVTIFFFRILTF